MTKSELMQRIPATWKADHFSFFIESFVERLSGDNPSLPNGWVAKSWAKNPAFYADHRNETVAALNGGQVYDDSDSPLPRPK